MNNKCFTYRKDLYYINDRVGDKDWHRKERVVSFFTYYLTKLLHPRKYKRYNSANVLYEKNLKWKI